MTDAIFVEGTLFLGISSRLSSTSLFGTLKSGHQQKSEKKPFDGESL